jgi:hypothetical protein
MYGENQHDYPNQTPASSLTQQDTKEEEKTKKRKEVCLAGIPFLFLPPSDMSKSSLLSIVV